jgi:hypothetical protein
MCLAEFLHVDNVFPVHNIYKEDYFTPTAF